MPDQTLPPSWTEKLTLYLTEVGLKRVGPVAMGSLVAALLTLMAAHQGLLESWGITYGTWPINFGGPVPTGPCIVLELDTLSGAALTLLSAIVASLITAAGHHVTQVISKPSE